MSSPDPAPPVVDDIAYVLGLPPDRQSAVFAALVQRFARDTTPTGMRAEWFRALVDALTPNMPDFVSRPLPTNIDPADPVNWATDEELDALTAKAHARR